MLDSRKGTLVKKSFSSDLEYNIFRFATVEMIEELIFKACHKQGILNESTVKRLKAGKTVIEGLRAVRRVMATCLVDETVVLEKPNFKPLKVTFKWEDDCVVMKAKKISYVMNYGCMEEPEKYLRWFNDYQCAIILNK